MNDKKDNAIMRLFSLLSRPLRVVIGVSITVFGINIFGVMGAFGIIAIQKDFFEKYFELILGALVVMIFLIIVALIFISISLCIALISCNPYIEEFNTNLSNCRENCNNILLQACELEKEKKCIEGCTKDFSENVDRLYGLVTEMELAGNIINKNKLMDIESHVPSNTDIIIFSSKYRLDEEFKPIIINNIRRGVTYKYIVSGADSSSPKHMRFTQIVEEWYHDYKDLVVKEQQYLVIKNKGKSKGRQGSVNNCSKEECDKFFFDHIKEYCSPFESDTLTIMLYRKGRGNDLYSVVVNLPSKKEGYYSYILPDNNDETSNIIDSILGICKKEREHNYRGDKNEC